MLLTRGVKTFNDAKLKGKQVDNYQEIIQELLTAYPALKSIMSLKIYLLDSHVDFFVKLECRQTIERKMSAAKFVDFS